DDLACLQIEDRRRRVVRRDQCKEAISLAEGFKRLEHGVVPVVGSHDALAVEDVDVGCLPISRFLSGLDFYREALSGSGPERNLEKSRRVDLLDPPAVDFTPRRCHSVSARAQKLFRLVTGALGAVGDDLGIRMGLTADLKDRSHRPTVCQPNGADRKVTAMPTY